MANNDFEALKQKAETGDMEAQYALGYGYIQFTYGKGTRKDLREGLIWLEKAALQGHVEAPYIIGHCYDEGIGVKQNKTQAAIWLQMAAQRGQKHAANHLRAIMAVYKVKLSGAAPKLLSAETEEDAEEKKKTVSKNKINALEKNITCWGSVAAEYRARANETSKKMEEASKKGWGFITIAIMLLFIGCLIWLLSALSSEIYVLPMIGTGFFGFVLFFCSIPNEVSFAKSRANDLTKLEVEYKFQKNVMEVALEHKRIAEAELAAAKEGRSISSEDKQLHLSFIGQASRVCINCVHYTFKSDSYICSKRYTAVEATGSCNYFDDKRVQDAIRTAEESFKRYKEKDASGYHN